MTTSPAIDRQSTTNHARPHYVEQSVEKLFGTVDSIVHEHANRAYKTDRPLTTTSATTTHTQTCPESLALPLPQIMSLLKSAAQGPIFIGLNVLRTLSMVSLLLVFIANIVTLVGDGEAIREDRTSAVPVTTGKNATSNSTAAYKCDYIFNSTIPDQAGGAFWSVLNRVFIRESFPRSS